MHPSNRRVVKFCWLHLEIIFHPIHSSCAVLFHSVKTQELNEWVCTINVTASYEMSTGSKQRYLKRITRKIRLLFGKLDVCEVCMHHNTRCSWKSTPPFGLGNRNSNQCWISLQVTEWWKLLNKDHTMQATKHNCTSIDLLIQYIRTHARWMMVLLLIISYAAHIGHTFMAINKIFSSQVVYLLVIHSGDGWHSAASSRTNLQSIVFYLGCETEIYRPINFITNVFNCCWLNSRIGLERIELAGPQLFD